MKMKYKKAYFTRTAESQILRHEELSKEEIEEWLNNPVFERHRMTDGFCLTNIIYRPNYLGVRKKHKIFIYYRERRKKFEVFNVHKGKIGDKCIDIKKKLKMKIKASPKKRRIHKRKRRKGKK
ncbi:MAG: hypothetical protein ACTSRS_12650 [Candidatus Helarchaeota archaeon]